MEYVVAPEAEFQLIVREVGSLFVPFAGEERTTPVEGGMVVKLQIADQGPMPAMLIAHTCQKYVVLVAMPFTAAEGPVGPTCLETVFAKVDDVETSII
jgi:hypothetical protein